MCDRAVTQNYLQGQPGKSSHSYIDYIINRTLLRPRDVIQFFNICVKRAVNEPKINVNLIKEAEGEYSRERLRSLADEWSADFPCNNYLFLSKNIITNQNEHFLLKDIDEHKIMEFCLELEKEEYDVDRKSSVAISAKKYCDDQKNPFEVLKETLIVFHKVGMVGIKLSPTTPFIWSDQDRSLVSKAEINEDTKFAIHPMFHKVLVIFPRFHGHFPKRLLPS